jgi:hypothetical protein
VVLRFLARWRLIIALVFILAVVSGTSNDRPPTLFENVSLSSNVYDLSSAWGVSWTDFDQDGNLDLFYSNHLHLPSTLYRGLGDGTFAPVSEELKLGVGDDDHSATWGDQNNDGYPDLFSTSGVHQPDHLFRNSEGSVFDNVTQRLGLDHGDQGRGRSALWADFNLDGLLDLHVINWNTPNLYYVQAPDHFTDMAQESGLDSYREEIGASVCDVDSDGDLDLYLNTHGNERANKLYLNRGDGRFVQADEASGTAVTGTSYSSSFADYDNDGDFDLAVARDVYSDIVLLENQGDGRFQDVTDRAGFSGVSGTHPSWADYDNDGWLDLFLMVGGKRDEPARQDRLFRNLKGLSFEEVSSSSGLSSSIGKSEAAAWGDYDGDGFLDLALTRGGGSVNPFGPNQLFRNRGNSHHWLKVQLVGRASNRDGTGARLKLVVGDRAMTRQAFPYNGMAQNSPLVHFGLGTEQTARRLEVFWPSGLVQLVHHIPADRTLTLLEPETDEAVSSPISLLLQSRHVQACEELLSSLAPDASVPLLPDPDPDLVVQAYLEHRGTNPGRGQDALAFFQENRTRYTLPPLRWVEDLAIGHFSMEGVNPEDFRSHAERAYRLLKRGDSAFETASSLKLRVWTRMWGNRGGQSVRGYLSQGFLSQAMAHQRFPEEVARDLWKADPGRVLGPYVLREGLDVRPEKRGSPILHVLRMGSSQPGRRLPFRQFRGPIERLIRQRASTLRGSRLLALPARRFFSPELEKEKLHWSKEIQRNRPEMSGLERARRLQAFEQQFNRIFSQTITEREPDDAQVRAYFNEQRRHLQFPLRYRLDHIHLGQSEPVEKVLKRLEEGASFDLVAEEFRITPLVLRKARKPTSAQRYRVISNFSEQRLRAEFPQDDVFQQLRQMGSGFLTIKTGSGTSLIRLVEVLPAQDMEEQAGLRVARRQLLRKQKEALLRELFPDP